MVDLLPSEEQTLIAETTRAFLSDHLPRSRLVNGGGAASKEREIWNEVAALGWFGLGVDERHGGTGYGLTEQVLFARELGRALASPSLLSTSMAAYALARCEAANVLPGLLDGSVRVAPTLRLASSDGTRRYMAFDARGCDYVLFISNTRVELYEWREPAQENGAMPLDEAVSLDIVSHPGKSVLELTDNQGAIRRLNWALCSAYLAGIAEVATELAVEHAKTRKQFGRQIGAFQAVKHACADMALRAEAAWAQVSFASAGSDPMDEQFAAAFIVAARAAAENAAKCIQLHGGMGFTSEMGIHHLLKRAHLMRQLGGGVRSAYPFLVPLSPLSK